MKLNYNFKLPLKNKKILFFGPLFFSYSTEIFNNWWIHLRSATRFMDCINTSLGVLNPNRFRGRLFN